jgi:3-phenylpropionate/trans-cinnamate dioxygenase ferredoxin reductase subunit
MIEQPSPVIIVGAGAAASEAAVSLRQQGYAGAIVILGEEAWPPYHRPPLSKAFLAGEAALESLPVRPAAAYAKAQIELRSGVRVTAIDRPRKQVVLADGSRLAYHKLVLATGGRPRGLPQAESLAPQNLHYIRTIGDIVRLKEQFRPGRRLVIIGGGYIGLEAAAVAAQCQLQVTVLEAATRVLARVTAPEVSAFFDRVHRAHGVAIHTGAQVASLRCGAGAIAAITCTDGTEFPCDLVIAGVGQLPNSELAEAAGLHIDNGVAVDEYGRSSDPDILAAGDCASYPSGFLGRRLRLESVPHAVELARTVAATICGTLKPYDPVPWFWSNQYDLRLQIAGLSHGYDRVVIRQHTDAQVFAAFYLKDGILIAADIVNHPAEFMLARKLVGMRVACCPSQLADPAFPLKHYMDAIKTAA